MRYILLFSVSLIMALFMWLGAGIIYFTNLARYPIMLTISIMGLALTTVTSLALRKAIRKNHSKTLGSRLLSSDLMGKL